MIQAVRLTALIETVVMMAAAVVVVTALKGLAVSFLNALRVVYLTVPESAAATMAVAVAAEAVSETKAASMGSAKSATHNVKTKTAVMMLAGVLAAAAMIIKLVMLKGNANKVRPS